MAENELTASLAQAQRFLEEGRFAEALEVMEKLYGLNPQDERIRDFYQQLLIADGVKRSRVARDIRRDGIRSLGKGGIGFYSDDARVLESFEGAVESFDKVLSIDSSSAKALMLKAGALDRMDRKGNRQRVVELFERALELHPGNQELVYARERILRTCVHCAGSGFCPDCGGSGEVSALFIKSRCPTCGGSGVCAKCGLF